MKALIILALLVSISILGLAFYGGQPFNSTGAQILDYAKQGIDKIMAYGEGTSPTED